MKALSIALLMVLGTLGLHGQNPAQPKLDNPSAVLEKEHTVILMVVNAMREDVARLREGKQVDPRRLEMALDFFINFADACHHRKEEDLYFPATTAAGGPAQFVQTSEFMNEHAYYRFLLGKVQEGLEEDSVSPKVAGPLSTYLASVSSHIRKENQLLFKETRPWLGAEKNKQLVESFEEIEKSLGEGFHEKYHRIAMELAGKDHS